MPMIFYLPFGFAAESLAFSDYVVRVQKLQSPHEVPLELYFAGGECLCGTDLAGHGLYEEIVVGIRGVVCCRSVCTTCSAHDAFDDAVFQRLHEPYRVAAAVGYIVVTLAKRESEF